MSRRRQERGATAVEFALTFSLVLVPLLLGMMEFGWYFFQQILTENAMRSGTRVAAMVPLEEAEAVAVETITAKLAASQVRGTPQFTTSIVGSAPVSTLIVEVQIPYPGLTGVLPGPANLGARWSRLLEDQPEE